MSIIKSDQYNTDWQFKVLKGLQSVSDKIAALGGGSTNPVQVIPNILYEENSSSSINENIKSVSFASVGTADALISFDGGQSFVPLKAGASVNMDAGAINNFYPAHLFRWDTSTNSGSALLITYNK